MNSLAVALGIFILFIMSLSSYDLMVYNILGFVSGITLILAGVTSIKKCNQKIPFYLAIVSFITLSVLMVHDLNHSFGADYRVGLVFVILFGLITNHYKPRKENKWTLLESDVDTSAEHIELRYGTVESGAWDDWVPVAYVSALEDKVFHVQYLLQSLDEQGKVSINAASKELNFYLIEKDEPDPWAYAQHHCGSTANVYGDIHWSFIPECL